MPDQNQPLESGPTHITYDQFKIVEILVGEVKAVETVPKSKKLVKMTVDFGPRGQKTVLAGIAKTLEDPPSIEAGGIQKILGRRFAFVYNFEPRPMFGIVSEAMMLAAPHAEDADRVAFIECKDAVPGSRLT